MYKIITFKKDDVNFRGLWNKCKDYLADNNFPEPSADTIIVQVTEDLIIQGLVGIEQVFHIEPLIADNGTIGLRLESIAFGIALTSQSKRIELAIKDIRMDKMQPMLEKDGYIFLEKTNIFTKQCQ